jgi:transcriptional regulator with GAF, ATPase, and Fis domain
MQRLGKAIVLAFLAWLSLVSLADAADTNRVATKRVLAIAFSQEGLPFTETLIRSLRSNLNSASPYPVELNIEFADRFRYADTVYLQKFTDLLRYKYSQPPMEVVLGLGDEAAGIVTQYGEALFGNVPMIAVTINPDFQKDSTAKAYLRNLVYGFDVLGQVILIGKLLPEARRLFIVSGSSQTDRGGARLVRENLRNYHGPLEVVYLSDMSKEALLAKVARLPEHAVVLYTSFIKDAEGKTFVSRDVMSEIAQTANAPVFGFFDIYLGYGIVGGYLLSPVDQGKRLADAVLQILNDGEPAAINTAPPENRLEFDWHQLKRWGIDERQLPPGSVVRFKEFSLWDSYRKYIVAIILVVFSLSVLVFLLWTANVRRRRAEARLVERLALEKRLAEFSARFVDLPAESVDSHISEELKKLGGFLKVDRVSLFEFPENNPGGAILHSSAVAQVPPPPPLIEYGRFTWLHGNILQGQTVQFHDVEELPPKAEAEIAYMQSQGIKSAVLMPVTIGQITWGVLSFAMLTHHRKWSPEAVQRYNAVAQVIAHAISSKQSRKALLQSKNFNRSVLDSLTYHIAVLDRQGTVLDVNESWMRFARENDATSLERIGRGINYLDVCRRSSESGDALAQAALEGLRSVLEGSRDNFDLEYPCDAPTNKRWFMMRVIPFSGLKGGAIVSHIDNTEQKLAHITLTTAFSEIEQLKSQLEDERAYLQEEIRLEHDYEGIIGQSAALQYVLYKIEQVAATETACLVLGENGTGKELVCRAIHSLSPRKARSLVKVNCAALPANLIESELFGHERGAFTGAQSRRTGRFEVANGGTIFLDEIGELPLELQGKLLRVLEDGEFERLGSSMTMKVDVRVIAATNRDLEKRVREGFFREDLYYRLNVFPITVPPLRERREDIPMLTRFFVEKSARKLGKFIKFIPNNALTRLQEYRWPGNVRELKNVIERAVINSTNSKLQLADDLCMPDSKTDTDSETLKSLKEIETSHIVRVLEKTNWRIDGSKGAAMILKVNPSTLRSRMRKLGINKPKSAPAFNATGRRT